MRPNDWALTHELARDLPPDAAEFVDLLNDLSSHELNDFFARDAEIIVTRAPGRLDLMGGIADYSGSLVLEMPIAEATFAALQIDESRTLKIISLGTETASHHHLAFEMSLDELTQRSSRGSSEPISYEIARDLFRADAASEWAAYVAGAFLVLMRERGAQFNTGGRILLSSNVPEGKGVSSSAAIEVAAMSAIVAAFDLDITPREIALLCQQVENLVVGAPCGVMDQMTAVCGEKNRLLAMLCQPAEVKELIDLPQGIAVWGVDSQMRHSVGAGDYGSVRVGAFIGYRIIAEAANLNARATDAAAHVEIDDPLWRGYLANIAPAEFESRWSTILPERIAGHEFLARYGGTSDTVTRIAPEKTYAVKIPTAHPIYENFRVRLFAELLRSSSAASGRQNELLGELMYQSHASYSACGLGSAGTDRLVELVREAGPAGDLYGAKITGGGSGGTIAVLGRRNAESAVRAIAEQYGRERGVKPRVFSGSSAGSAAFGHLRLTPIMN